MGTFIHGPMVYLFVFLFAWLFGCLLAGRIVLSNGLDHWIFLIFHRTSIAHAGSLHFCRIHGGADFAFWCTGKKSLGYERIRKTAAAPWRILALSRLQPFCAKH